MDDIVFEYLLRQDTPRSGTLHDAAYYHHAVPRYLSDLGTCVQCEYAAVQAHFGHLWWHKLLVHKATAVKKGNQCHLTCWDCCLTFCFFGEDGVLLTYLANYSRCWFTALQCCLRSICKIILQTFWDQSYEFIDVDRFKNLII